MKILNTETQEIIDLRHPSWQCDIMPDIIGNCGRPNMVWDGDKELWTMSQDDIDWWQRWIDGDASVIEAATQYRQLVESQSPDAQIKLLDQFEDGLRQAYESVDMEDQPRAALDYIHGLKWPYGYYYRATTQR